MNKEIKCFKHEGLSYKLWITSEYELLLDVIGGASKKGVLKKRLVWDWDDEPEDMYDTHDDIDLIINPFGLIKKIEPDLVKFIYNKKPVAFFFTASTERKVKIYKWFAKRLFDKYFNNAYNYYDMGLSFRFYRK